LLRNGAPVALTCESYSKLNGVMLFCR
jgi:hypothetical protein